MSRIDKLFMDRQASSPADSLRLRRERGLHIVVGDDVALSWSLQLTLLTMVNLGARCFGGNVVVYAPASLWRAPCLTLVSLERTLGAAVIALGGTLAASLHAVPRHLLIGDAASTSRSVRVTFDGWCAAVGPAEDLPRLQERTHCSLACVAAAAIGTGEMFSEFAGIGVSAGRQVVGLSLWRPDLPSTSPEALGPPLVELPASVAVFGLGHLGQAYLWTYASLPWLPAPDATVLLCDDDTAEVANVETGALLDSSRVGSLKTRVAADWLERRGFSTRLLERRVDESFRRTQHEPMLALSGFDSNDARHCLASAGFAAMFDSGIGGEANNFDTIAYRAWPNPRNRNEIWPVDPEAVSARARRDQVRSSENDAYRELNTDECGRLLIAGASVAVPFVGALASTVVVAELLKTLNGGPVFSDIKVRMPSLHAGQVDARLHAVAAPPVRGVATRPAGPVL